MRESIGGTWLLGIMLVFIVFFVAFVSISINYSKAFRLKTEMINILQQYEGPTNTSLKRIDNAMSNYGYTVKMKCPSVTNDTITIKSNRSKGSYCLSKAKTGNKTYYTITIGFKLSLPLFGELYTFKVSGETDALYLYEVNEISFNDPNKTIY